jgi:hypothetical protein
MSKEIKSLDDVKLLRRNPNKGSERGNKVLDDSLHKLGAGRSIVVDVNNEVLCGNKTAQKANEMGLKVRVVETDGHELVIVKRTDLNLEDDVGGKARSLVYADNRVSELDYDLDAEVLAQDVLDGIDLSWQYSEDEMKKALQEEQDRMNRANNEQATDEASYKFMVTCPAEDERNAIMQELIERGYACEFVKAEVTERKKRKTN